MSEQRYAKVELRQIAIDFLADNQPDLENMSGTQSRIKLIQKLYSRLIEAYLHGVGVGAHFEDSESKGNRNAIPTK